MAAPPQVTIHNLSGKYVMNSRLSGDAGPVLALQGFSWLTRRAILLATVTLHVRQYERDGDVHVDIDQFVTGGIQTSPEFRTLDWTMRPHSDRLFGPLEGRSRMLRLPAADLGAGADSQGGLGPEDVAWLFDDWEDGREGDRVHSQVISQRDGWVANQLWGFMVVEGDRRYCRRVVVKKGEEIRRVVLVYDFKGEL